MKIKSTYLAQRLLMITLKKLINVYETKKAIGEVLGISAQAVSQWPDGQVPICHQLMFKYILAPERFANDRLPHQLAPRMAAHRKVMKRLGKALD